MLKLRLLGADGGLMPGARLPGFIVNDVIAVDCGSLTCTLSLQEQFKLEHVLISHSHLDHVCALPFLANNLMDHDRGALPVYGCARTLEGLKKHLLNNILWPDFTEIPSRASPVLRFIALTPARPVEMKGLKITPVPVHHTVPSSGFLIEDHESAVLISGDTGPTDQLWAVCNAHAGIKAVFVETSFPDRLSGIAKLSGHLTPALLARELRKLTRPVPVYIFHLKPAFREEILEALSMLEDRRIHIAEAEQCFTW